MKKDIEAIYEKTDDMLIEEVMEVINKVFEENVGLNETKLLTIFKFYKNRFEEQGMQKNHLQDILQTLKAFIIQTENMETLDETLRLGIEAYKKQRWVEINRKLAAFRNA